MWSWLATSSIPKDSDDCAEVRALSPTPSPEPTESMELSKPRWVATSCFKTLILGCLTHQRMGGRKNIISLKNIVLFSQQYNNIVWNTKDWLIDKRYVVFTYLHIFMHELTHTWGLALVVLYVKLMTCCATSFNLPPSRFAHSYSKNLSWTCGHIIHTKKWYITHTKKQNHGSPLLFLDPPVACRDLPQTDSWSPRHRPWPPPNDPGCLLRKRSGTTGCGVQVQQRMQCHQAWWSWLLGSLSPANCRR